MRAKRPRCPAPEAEARLALQVQPASVLRQEGLEALGAGLRRRGHGSLLPQGFGQRTGHRKAVTASRRCAAERAADRIDCFCTAWARRKPPSCLASPSSRAAASPRPRPPEEPRKSGPTRSQQVPEATAAHGRQRGMPTSSHLATAPRMGGDAWAQGRGENEPRDAARRETQCVLLLLAGKRSNARGPCGSSPGLLLQAAAPLPFQRSVRGPGKAECGGLRGLP